MQHTNDEDLVPAAVAPGITVHHKYGVVQGYVHDAALLSAGDRSYAVVIYTWGPDDADSADRLDLIHDLTRQLTGALFGRSADCGEVTVNSLKINRSKVAQAPLRGQDERSGNSLSRSCPMEPHAVGRPPGGAPDVHSF